jgi:cation transport ATPase
MAMSFFSKLLSSGAASLVDSIGGAIDRNVTSDHERGQLKIALQQEVNKSTKTQLEATAQHEAEISDRHKYDMQSDSWLSKNIRPLALAFLTVTTVLLAYATIFYLDVTKTVLLQPWITLLTALLLTVYGFYFGSRGIEKMQKAKVDALKARIKELELLIKRLES